MIPNIYTNDEIISTLRKIQRRGFKSAVIAGGAVRDLYFDKIIRDVDIFVQDPEHSREFSERWSKKPDSINEDFWDDTFGIPSSVNSSSSFSSFGVTVATKRLSRGNYADSDIYSVWQIVKNFIPYEIIVTRIPPTEFVENNFDIGLCKAYCDGTKFRFTADFMRDMQKRTMTIVSKKMDVPQMVHVLKEHFPRISHRYPGYSLVIPEWNQEIYKKAKDLI